MPLPGFQSVIIEPKKIRSVYLKRDVSVDFYLPQNFKPGEVSLLLINDGQDLVKMDFATMLDGLINAGQIMPVLCVGIHAGDRLSEYGTAHILDYKNRGSNSFGYQQFLVEELLPLVHIVYGVDSFNIQGIAGFSLGGLSALDMLWSYPTLFSVAGIFSGSFWWRSKEFNKDYDESKDRIMHQKIRSGVYNPKLRFYFTTGSLDETADRNNNGVIDSIDDTMALIEELKNLGYSSDNIKYINYEDGKHDVATWGRAMPQFLLWAFSIKK